MMKKYFKEEKVKKGEVINTKSGHQIRASVKISLVMLDPVSLFKKKKENFHQTLCSVNHYGVVLALLEDFYARVGICLMEFVSSVMTLLPSLLH